MSLLKKKSTREMVGFGEPAPQEEASPESKKRPKKEKTPKKEGKPHKSMKEVVRSRGFAGGICVVAGLLVWLIGVPLLQQANAATIQVVTLAQDVSAGTKITMEDLVVEERGRINLPFGAFDDTSAAVGKYISVAGKAGDILTADRVTDEILSDDPELVTLPAGKLAISASLATLQQSVSGKLRAGDVIQVFAVEESQETAGKYVGYAVPELQRVEVLSVTNSAAQNVVTGDRTPDMDRQAATVILAVNVDQAAVVAELGYSATLYAALVTRGDADVKEAALKQQDDYFTQKMEPAIPADPAQYDVPHEVGGMEKEKGET